jgi:ectonucleoside triphosphate diphosphohydrolase 4
MPLTVEDSGKELVGTGNYAECKTRLEPLLNLTVPCQQDPCSLNGVHQPPIDFAGMQFYGFSEFWYTMEDVYRDGGVYDFNKFEKEATVSSI